VLRHLLIGLLALPLPAAAAPWKLAPETTVSVDVAWEGRNVTVHFPQLDGQIDFDQAHPETAKATISVATGVATTGVAVVDQLVRSRDYLDAADYPTIGFHLDKLTQTSKQTADVAGRITLRGVTKPVAFKATVTRYGPAADDPKRFEAGFDLTGSIDRTEFGSNGGLPEVAAVLPVRIRLVMASQ
jgi:polyisoprenoid-binding protein YceI